MPDAIAVTEYYLIDTYEEFLKHKAAGRLPGVALLFPNIELRLAVATKTSFVNVHLLVSPEDPGYLSEVKRILKRLQFHAFNDRFDCTREELIKLGKRAAPAINDDGVAPVMARRSSRSTSTNCETLSLRANVKEEHLIAVAGGEGDGTSGVRQAADATVPAGNREVCSHHLFDQPGPAGVLDRPAGRDFGRTMGAIRRLQALSPRQRLP